MSQKADDPTIPRAVIHKEILDAASEQPAASMEALASDIPMATTDLVERVLTEYGDPSSEEEATTPESPDPTMAQESPAVAADELSESQWETLRAISNHPDATQQELADMLGVTAPTVSNRMNAIDGFDWATREAFVETLFETNPAMQNEKIEHTTSNSTEPESVPEELEERITSLEQQVEPLADTGAPELGLDDPELVHKVLHACLKADTITEEEELRILQTILG